MIIIRNDQKYQEYKYELRDEILTDLLSDSKILFSQDTIFLNAKRVSVYNGKVDMLPDAFLFDFSDKDKVQVHLIEVEIYKDRFYSHILARTTKLLMLLGNPSRRIALGDALLSVIMSSKGLSSNFERYLGNKITRQHINEIIEKNANIFLVIDEEKGEFMELVDVYRDTWGERVKMVVLKRFTNGKESIYSLSQASESTEFDHSESVISKDVSNEIPQSKDSRTQSDDEALKKKITHNPHDRKVSLTKTGGKGHYYNDAVIGWETAPPKEGESYRMRLETGQVFRTSPVQLMTETDDSLTIMTKNSLYDLKVFGT